MRTLINFILDKSGSMACRQDATIDGFNEYLHKVNKEAKKDKKGETLFSLTMFDTEIHKPYVTEKLSQVEDLDTKMYSPDGWTALYDAVCKTVGEVEKKIKEEKEKFSVVTVILTDGLENSSKEYTERELADKIKRLQKDNWTFVFLGANQDSWATAQKWGIHAGNIANFSTQSDKAVKRAFENVAGGTAYAMYSASNLDAGMSMSLGDFFQGKKNISEE